MSSITALGTEHLIGGHIHIIEDCVHQILNMKPPQDAMGVRAFLGTLSMMR